MSFIKGSYPALIGGISQQVKISRKADQVERQLNMLSDPVTGPRRRGGYELFTLLPELEGKDFAAELVTFGPDSFLCTASTDGEFSMFAVQSDDYAPGTQVLTQYEAYLQASTSKAFRFAKHGSALLVLNTEQEAVLGDIETEKNVTPKELGWFYVNQGALATKFDLTVRVGTDNYQVTHTTPDTGATNATPVVVAAALASALKAHATIGTAQGFTYSRTGAYVFIKAPAGSASIDINSEMSTNMLVCSANSSQRDSSKLPARLPVEADGYVMQVGYRDNKQYFEWDYTDTAWKERAGWGLRAPIKNLPLRVSIEEMSVTALEGVARTAGDADNAADPYYVGKRLTGVGSFQGRLVLLCNEYVSMSSSKDMQQFYRSTIGGLTNDDPVEMASTSSYGVEYQYAMPFAGDLLLLSKASQALVSGRQTLTPQNAVITVAADYAMSLNSIPTQTGKSVLYGVGGTAGHSAIWEMVPSEFSERQLYAQDVTEHIPSLFVGDIRKTAVLPGAGYVLIQDSTNTLKLHQYMWAGTEKVHSCFHEWTCPDTVHSVHAFQDSFWIVTVGQEGDVRILRWRYVAKIPGVYESTEIPHLDRQFDVQYSAGGYIKVPEGMFEQSDFDQHRVLLYGRTANGTPYSYSPDSVELTQGSWRVHSRYFEPGTYVIGLKYLSRLQPSAPVLRDQYDQPILMERSVLQSVSLAVQDTGEVVVYSKDRARQTQSYRYSPVRLYSWDIDNGNPLVRSETLHVPARLDMQTAEFWFEADGCYDMQIVALEYGYRHNRRTERAVARGGAGAQ